MKGKNIVSDNYSVIIFIINILVMGSAILMLQENVTVFLLRRNFWHLMNGLGLAGGCVLISGGNIVSLWSEYFGRLLSLPGIVIILMAILSKILYLWWNAYENSRRRG